MNTLKNFLTGPEKKEKEPDLNNTEDLRKVIEKVEVIDSIDVDAIHSQLSEIAKEKAASRQQLGHGSDLRKTPDTKATEKPHRKFPEFEDFHEPKEKHFSSDQEANAIGLLETKDSNPYLKNDNVTAFFD